MSWISVKEKNPDSYGEYLGSTRARPRGWVFVYAPVGWICSGNYPVTHWQPLPNPPNNTAFKRDGKKRRRTANRYLERCNMNEIRSLMGKDTFTSKEFNKKLNSIIEQGWSGKVTLDFLYVAESLGMVKCLGQIHGVPYSWKITS